MHRKSFPQFIIISGSGKKVGKTYMAMALIRAFSRKFPLLALKISPHVHDSLASAKLIFAAEGFRIFNEMEEHHKNSGQFLKAGAFKSFFMETDDEHLETAFDIFMTGCNPHNHPVVCESGALSDHINPGILIFITDSQQTRQADKLKTKQRADIVLEAQSFDPDDIICRISFSDHKWDILDA